MSIQITRKKPRIAGGTVVDDRPHLFIDLPEQYPNGYFRLVHPRWTEGHNLTENATIVGHLEEAADLVDQGYRLRMSERGSGPSPALILARNLLVKRTPT